MEDNNLKSETANTDVPSRYPPWIWNVLIVLPILAIVLPLGFFVWTLSFFWN